MQMYFHQALWPSSYTSRIVYTDINRPTLLKQPSFDLQQFRSFRFMPYLSLSCIVSMYYCMYYFYELSSYKASPN
jgi:hypothetical protein